MDIACPNCAATYRVPDSLLGNGKALRCAACDHAWVPEAPPAAAPVMLELPDPLPSARPPPMEPAPLLPDLNPSALYSLAPNPLAPNPLAPNPAALEPFPAQASYPSRLAPPTTPPPLQRRGGPGQMAAVMRSPARRRPALALPLAWAVSVVLVLLALAGLVVFGEQIALAWPPFARMTALLSG